jgi:hypothetical protein
MPCCRSNPFTAPLFALYSGRFGVREKVMRKLVAAALFGPVLALPVSPAAARVDCTPYCDFRHDYGPYDLSWQRPGLTCYPRCDVRGNCAPTPVCFVAAAPAGHSAFVVGPLGRRPVGRITVRSRQYLR